MPSREFTARIATIHPWIRLSPFTRFETEERGKALPGMVLLDDLGLGDPVGLPDHRDLPG